MAAPDKPFFLYYVPGGTHPRPATKEGSSKFKASSTWLEPAHEQIFANQRLGADPGDHLVTLWPDTPPKRDTLSADEKKLFAAKRRCSPPTRPTPTTRSPIQAVEDLGSSTTP